MAKILKPEIEVIAVAAPFQSGIDILLEDTSGSRKAVGVAVQFREIDEDERLEPTLRLTLAMGQKLMDDLWRCGLRPSEGTGSAGALRAVERHLEDMRKIAFDMMENRTIEFKPSL
jgi:hypothetical protein